MHLARAPLGGICVSCLIATSPGVSNPRGDGDVYHPDMFCSINSEACQSGCVCTNRLTCALFRAFVGRNQQWGRWFEIIPGP